MALAFTSPLPSPPSPLLGVMNNFLRQNGGRRQVAEDRGVACGSIAIKHTALSHGLLIFLSYMEEMRLKLMALSCVLCCVVLCCVRCGCRPATEKSIAIDPSQVRSFSSLLWSMACLISSLGHSARIYATYKHEQRKQIAGDTHLQ